MSIELLTERKPENYSNFRVEKVFVAGNRGPCGGVNMALEGANQGLDIVAGRETVYTNWDIVNNKPIMNELKSRGLVNFKNDWSLVPDNSIVFVSAHSVAPDFYVIAQKRNCLIIDVTCQLVTRVHNLVKKAEKDGKYIIYVGARGHPEARGVTGELRPDNFTLIDSKDDVRSVPLPEGPKVVYSQTTLATDEIRDIMAVLHERFPDIEIPPRRDICYATDNRQAAVEKLLPMIDFLLVVGSQHSHNSQELRKKGEKAGIPAYSVDTPDEIDLDWFTPDIKNVGMTSGASVPDYLFLPVLDRFKELNPNLVISFEPQVILEREMTFKLPEESINALHTRFPAAVH